VPIAKTADPGPKAASALPGLKSTVWLACGFGTVALSGYVFTIAAGQLAKTPSAAVIQFYFLLNTVILGVCAGLEQVTDRRIAYTLATGSPLRPAVRHALRDAVGVAVCTVAGLIVLYPVFIHRSLHGNLALFVSLLVGVCTAAAASVARGVLVGARRYGSYALAWVVEGLARLAPVVVILVAGPIRPWLYGYVYVAAFAVAALVAVALWRGVGRSVLPPIQQSQRRAGSGLIPLAGGGLLTMAVANLPQLVIGARLGGISATPAAAAAVTAFGQAFLIARIVITAATPIQAGLLPNFTAAVAVGDLAGLRRTLRRALLLLGIVALAWAAVVLAGGQWVMRVVYSASTPTARLTFAAMGLGAALMVVNGVLQPGLVALGRFRWVPVCWAAGAAVTAAVAFLPGSAVTAATWASFAGPAVVAAMMMGLLGSTLGMRGRTRPVGADAGTDEPAAASAATPAPAPAARP
jgi:O-antigen/teichoic acid export membrane protein